MNKLLIPLLAASALLGGCQHATVRHTVRVPVEMVEHRHVQENVVIVHHHEGDYRSTHRHEHYNNYKRERVVVVTPRPVIRHQEVTVIERGHPPRSQPVVQYDRGHHATPRVPPHQSTPQVPSRHTTPQIPVHQGQPHTQPPYDEAVQQLRQVTSLPHALRRLPPARTIAHAEGPTSDARAIQREESTPAAKSQPNKKGPSKAGQRRATEHHAEDEDSGTIKAKGEMNGRGREEQHPRR